MVHWLVWPLVQWSTDPDHSPVHVQMHGQMHVHAGWSRGYSFDDRFTEALDCWTAPPRLSFPAACAEVAGFGEVRWRRSIRSAMGRGDRAGEPGAETHGCAKAVRRADPHPEDGRGLRGRGEMGLSQEGRVLPSAGAALGPLPDAHSASGPGDPRGTRPGSPRVTTAARRARHVSGPVVTARRGPRRGPPGAGHPRSHGTGRRPPTRQAWGTSPCPGPISRWRTAAAPSRARS